MKRFLWFVAGAAGAASILVASPEVYTRLRERVAGGPVGELEPGPAYEPPPPAAAVAEPEDDWDDQDTDEIAIAPVEGPADTAADDLRTRIGEGRARLREKAMAATPDLGDEAESADGDPDPGE